MTWILSNGSWSDAGVWDDGSQWQDYGLSSIKNNIQLFRKNNEFSTRFFEVINDVNSIQQIYLWLFNDAFIYSKAFGEFVYDNKLFDLSEFFSREYFSNNFPAIISAISRAGTFEAYIEIITSALGESNVTFEVPSASHLIIRMDIPTSIYNFGAWHNYEKVDIIPSQTQYPNGLLSFRHSTAPLTVNETLKLIEMLNVNGIFVEVIFNN